MRAHRVLPDDPDFLFAIVLVAILCAVDRRRDHRHRRRLVAADGAPRARRVPRAAQPRVRAGLRLDSGMSDARDHLSPHPAELRCRRSSSPARCMVATAILIESALSFLGLGDPNVMSWGFMIGAGRTVLRTRGGSARSPASRSCSPCWRSTWSARASTTRSIRGCASVADERRPILDIRDLTRRPSAAAPIARTRSRTSSLTLAPRRDPLRRRRIGLGQVGDGARDHGPAAAARARERRARSCSRARTCCGDARRDARDPRQPHLDDLPGADDRAESGA